MKLQDLATNTLGCLEDGEWIMTLRLLVWNWEYRSSSNGDKEWRRRQGKYMTMEWGC